MKSRLSIKEALKKYHKIEIELLLQHVLKKPKEFLFMNPDKSLSAYQLISLSALIKRREKGEPIAYILGYKDFYGLRFKVNHNVLIPRPETEMVVERIVKSEKLKVKSGITRILDLGTGSGCIIISLVKSLSSSPSPSPQGRGKLQNCSIPPPLGGRLGGGIFEFYASDISLVALKVAKQNAKAHGVKIKFIHSDILKNVRMNFDIIIANLPYLAPTWKSVELKYEPKKALFAKESGLMIIRRLLEQIAVLKQKPKLIYLEFDPRQKSDLVKLIKKSLPGSKTKFYKDYSNLWRCAKIGLN